MTDVFTRAQRSWVMSRVPAKDTTPEMAVRSLVHRLGYRFRLHRSDLPGCPDIVFPSRKKAIFVHGCFWHGHTCRRGARKPASNASYWRRKIESNRKRDIRVRQTLRSIGWNSLAIWECQTRDSDSLRKRIRAFLQ